MSAALIKPIPNYIQNHTFKQFIELCNSGKYLLEYSHFISQDIIQNNKQIILNQTILNKSFFTNIEFIDFQLREFIYMVHKDLEIIENIQHISYIKENEEMKENCTLQLDFDIAKIEIYDTNKKDTNKKVNTIPFNELKRLFFSPINVKMILQPKFYMYCENNIHFFGMKLYIHKIYY
jgi:hypothetical protein